MKFDILKTLDTLVWLPLVGAIVFAFASIFLAVSKDNKKALNYWILYQGILIVIGLVYLVINYPGGYGIS